MTTYNLTIKQMAEIYENSKMPPLARMMYYSERLEHNKERFERFLLKFFSKEINELNENDLDVVVDFIILLANPKEMDNYFRQHNI